MSRMPRCGASLERRRPADRVSLGVGFGNRSGGSENFVELRHINEETESHNERAKNDGAHQIAFAVQFFGMFHGAIAFESERKIYGHYERDERKRQNKFQAIAHEKSAKEKHSRRTIKHYGDHQPFRGEVGERFSVLAKLAAFFEPQIFGVAFQRHEVTANHPVTEQERARRGSDGGNHEPSCEQTNWIVDGFGQDVEIGHVLAADRRNIVDAAHGPKREQSDDEQSGDHPAEANAGGGEGNPLHICEGDIYPAGWNWTRPFEGMK